MGPSTLAFCLLAVSCFLGSSHAGLSHKMCHRGFQVAGQYHECWEAAIWVNRYSPLYNPPPMLDGAFLQDYATHMCRVVKPKALECFREAVSKCDNAAKLIEVADTSGGACEHNHLNPFFKEHIIKYLVPVASNSQCFTIGAKSAHECYDRAGTELKNSGLDTVDITRFHKTADMFFGTVWNCLIEAFKGHPKTCQHWQLPMLMAVQDTALPSLFGMKLRPSQVADLELGNTALKNMTKTTPKPAEPSQKEKEDQPGKLYVLLQVFAKRPRRLPDGAVVATLDIPDSLQPQNLDDSHSDLENYLKTIMNDKTLSEREKKKLLRQHRRKHKEIQNFIKKLRNGSKKRKNDRQKKKTDSDSEGMIN